jgi:hypothetical protein
MEKLYLTGQSLGRAFKSRRCMTTKWPSLKLKTRSKQLLGSLPSVFATPAPVGLSLEEATVHAGPNVIKLFTTVIYGFT